jgi:IS1 family transposase
VGHLLGKGKSEMANVLPKKRQIGIINCLVEGCSVRSTSRLTGVHVATILSLLVRVGEGCEALHDEYVQDLSCDDLQLDEIWAYVGCKQRRTTATDTQRGDQYTFYALDRETKLVSSWLVGKRNWDNTVRFVRDLKNRLVDGVRPQISTDGWSAYPDAIERAFGMAVDYAQVIKDFGTVDPGRGRYSPPKVVQIEKTVIEGDPDEARITTSHVERSNLTMRMTMRRLTRLTNGFSKKLANLRAAVNLHFCWYNFCRIHQTLRVTPAMAAGISDHVWGLGELIDEALVSYDLVPREPKQM